MTTAVRSALLVIGLSVAACNDSSGPDVAGNYAKWSRSGPEVYQYDFRRSCFCLVESVRRVRIVVDHGTVTSVMDLETQQPVPPDDIERFYRITVDSLFRLVMEARQRADELRVEFDGTLGYPRDIQVDYIKNGVDDELGILAENLAPLTTGPLSQ